MNSNADIIEQLTEAYESLCDIGGAWERDIVLEAINQIKRLRVEIDLKGSRLDDAYAEVERLRAENDAYRQVYVDEAEFLEAFANWDGTRENLPLGWKWEQWDKKNEQ